MSDHTRKLVEEILKGYHTEEEQAAAAAASEPQDAAEALLGDLETLRSEYPDLPLEELASDDLFIRFARGKGHDFRTICEDFDHFIDSVRQSIRDEQRQQSKQKRQSGGGSRQGTSTYGLSRSQMDFLEAWNRDNPSYAMTPKQYAQSLKNG